MYTFHNDPTAEHLRYKKVLQKLSERYYWPGMAKDVNQYIIVAVKYLSKLQEAKAVIEANALSISNFLY